MNTPDADALVLSDPEKLVLQLYQQVRELELERALVEAQQSDAPSPSSDETLSDDEVAQQLLVAEREAMEARASYLLRNKIVEQVLITDPVIRAVHAGSNASFDERRLLPHLHTRDVLSMYLSSLIANLTTTTSSLTTATKALTAANAKNTSLATTLLSLAKPPASSVAAADEITDANLRAQLLEAEKDATAARRRWRSVKGVAAGVVVGSGVDWAGEEGLRRLVMEDEEDVMGERD
ncbi:uncharacterized protein LTHEOB_3920 [Neofusicoccum parvum]|nr:uncharacterized protein LTHEOB_3920 [Neofusicoccum parvum]